MGLLEKNNITKYLIAISFILIASIVGKKFKHYFDDEGYSPNEYKLIKRYLLNNDNNPYNSKKPNLWIHSKYEINARVWKSFGSRNTYDLNQPYLHLTIKSIIYHCEKSFNICLIDDDTFEKLIPDWKIKLHHLAEPFRKHYREFGLIKLIHEYGGIVVPNSFLCFSDLIHLHSPEKETKPFICENINHTTNSLSFIPDIRFMGAIKKCPIIKELIDFIVLQNSYPHYSVENDLTGVIEKWCIESVKNRSIKLLSGDMIGVMTTNKKPILLDNLMEEEYLDIPKNALGIFIPANDILNRQKYKWFSVISTNEILKGTSILNKYFIKVVGGIYDNISDNDTLSLLKTPSISQL